MQQSGSRSDELQPNVPSRSPHGSGKAFPRIRRQTAVQRIEVHPFAGSQVGDGRVRSDSERQGVRVVGADCDDYEGNCLLRLGMRCGGPARYGFFATTTTLSQN